MAAQHEIELSPSSFLLNLDTSLYCQEEHWEDECTRDGLFGEQENSQSYYLSDNNTPCYSEPVPPLLDLDLFWEDKELSCLVNKKQDQFNNDDDYFDTKNPLSIIIGPCSEAVDWILKVVSHYSFNSLTALLAVNYLDIFLFNFQFQREKKPWMTQLAAVSCLSLAAKVEETQS